MVEGLVALKQQRSAAGECDALDEERCGAAALRDEVGRARNSHYH